MCYYSTFLINAAYNLRIIILRVNGRMKTINIIKPKIETIKMPKEIARKPITVHKHILEVNRRGNLTNTPHNPPYLITEMVSAKLIIKVSIIATGRIRSIQISRLSGYSE